MFQATRFHPDLISRNAELDGHVHWLIGHTGRWLDQRHEEEGEPDDADESEDEETPHPVFHHLILLLPWRVGVFLGQLQQLH